jgi:HPt (histidine-containing phosphotransfer) domain-containing protein
MAPSSDPSRLLYSPLSSDPDLAEIVGLFVQEMPERIARLLERFREHDREGLRRAAHQLKGAAGSHGFTPISPAAGRLEDAIVQSRPEGEIARAMDELIDLCRRAQAGPAKEIRNAESETRNGFQSSETENVPRAI